MRNGYSRKWTRFVAQWTRINFVVFVVVAGGILLSAIADQVFALNWGYDPKTIPIGIGILVGGVIVYGFCRAIFRIFDT